MAIKEKTPPDEQQLEGGAAPEQAAETAETAPVKEKKKHRAAPTP